jgi:Flp pilus assembly pilin Flp
MLKEFIKDDSGAVTVDYVVLTGSLTGLGLATVGVVSGGVEDMAYDIAAALGATLDVAENVIASYDFSNGIGDWVGGQVMNIRNFGEILVLGPGESTSVPLTFPEGATTGFLTFDVIAGDSIDWESAFFFVDGQLVADLTAGAVIPGVDIADGPTGSFNWISSGPDASERATQLRNYSTEGITVSYERLDGNQDLGAQERWTDETVRVTLQIDNPTPTMQFSTTTNTDQPIDDEFFAIDNFDVSYQ